MTHPTFPKPSKQINSSQQALTDVLLRAIEQATEAANTKHYMNKQQTCEYLQISNNTLDKWIANGLPNFSIGKVRRFERQSIDNWLSTRV
ncbi:helix-turn-helix domain-containing protein [Leuconostoc mesenteroides]|uniref:helix-turn-helix domain-containing protein n=1 Tax=Leuconostoc mesenteroides TaxID=1245 RepID=UPI003B8EE2FA